MTPSFSPTRVAWVDKGGVLAIANLRGGGEYGKAWHDAGRLDKKQNVFDDFIAAGEYLIAEGIAGKGRIAIEGGSNGGLLVGRSEEHTSELQSLMRSSYAVFCLQQKNQQNNKEPTNTRLQHRHR